MQKSVRLFWLGILWAGGLAVVIAFLTIIANESQLPKVSIIALAMIGLVCIYAAFVMQGWTTAPIPIGTPLRATVLMVVVAAVMFSLARAAWPLPRRHELDAEEISSFEKPLKEQKTKSTQIIFACPTSDENACVYASQFPQYFRDSGWDVRTNIIERVTLAVPYSGVIIVVHASGTPNFAAGTGVWAALPPSLASVYLAFHDLGIEPEDITDQNLPDTTMRIYFGTEKHNAGDETQLTKSMSQIGQYLLQKAKND